MLREPCQNHATSALGAISLFAIVRCESRRRLGATPPGAGSGSPPAATATADRRTRLAFTPRIRSRRYDATSAAANERAAQGTDASVSERVLVGERQQMLVMPVTTVANRQIERPRLGAVLVLIRS